MTTIAPRQAQAATPSDPTPSTSSAAQRAIPRSYITRVQVSTDGGAFTDADISQCQQTGHAPCTWAFAWSVPAGSGAHSIAVKASDAVGNQQTTATVSTIYVDDLAPSVTTNVDHQSHYCRRQERRRQVVRAAQRHRADAGIGPATSGVERVEVLMAPHGSDWQPRTVVTSTNPNTWSIEYPLSAFDDDRSPLTSPTGQYTFTVRAIDRAGNVTMPANYANGSIRLDNTTPTAEPDRLQRPRL